MMEITITLILATSFPCVHAFKHTQSTTRNPPLATPGLYSYLVEVTSTAAMDACASGQWHGSPHRARLQSLHLRLFNVRLCRRVLCIDPMEAAYIDEELSHDAYARLRNCPPAFDQITRVPVRTAEAYKMALEDAMAAMRRALETLCEEWQYHYFLGKVRAIAYHLDQVVSWVGSNTIYMY